MRLLRNCSRPKKSTYGGDRIREGGLRLFVVRAVTQSNGVTLDMRFLRLKRTLREKPDKNTSRSLNSLVGVELRSQICFSRITPYGMVDGPLGPSTI